MVDHFGEGVVHSVAAWHLDFHDDEGVFAYSISPGGGAGVAPAMLPGATGRSPVCELALLRAGASDEELRDVIAYIRTLQR